MQARERYLEAQVMTATPQKLRLMLIEGAIQHARQALEFERLEQPEQRGKSISRCRAIVAELLGSIRPDQSPGRGWSHTYASGRRDPKLD